MEILVFLFVISKLCLVYSGDVAIENTTPKEGYKVHPDSIDDINDQLAESSQSVGQAYGNAVVGNGFKQSQDEVQNQDFEKSTAASVGHSIHLTNGLRQNTVTLSPIQVVESGPHQEYVQQQQQPHHQLYLHQFPIQHVQIFGAEASPLQQEQEGSQALGYSSYVEHVSEKDEDEIKSALQEGSVSDIKRLVPKSGISFKIYHNEKERQNSEIHSNLQTHFNAKPQGISVLHQKIRSESPVTVQPETYQTQILNEYQPTTVRNYNGEDYRNSQQLLQSQQQLVNTQNSYYAQADTQKPFVEENSKSSFPKSHFKISVAESNYNKQAELHRNLKSFTKASDQSFSNVSNQKQWKFHDRTNTLRGSKPGKTPEGIHYADSVAQTDGSKGIIHTQNIANSHNTNRYKTEDTYEKANHASSSHLSTSYITKTNQNGIIEQQANIPHYDQKVVLNRLSGNYFENIKPGHVISQGPAYTDHTFKGVRFVTPDSEASKSGHHSIITHLPKSSYVETKNSQNFDHQKALEGSTSFDLKNAIDSTGALIHQTNHITPPTTEIHPVEIQKQPLAYVVPEIPTSAVLIDNSIHNSPHESIQIKNLGHGGGSPQLPYHTEVTGKFYHSPQNIIWTSDYFKQGATFPSKDFHQQVLRLHVPKEEVFVKTPNVEFPASIISHVSTPQHKQPVTVHYDVPFIKQFPQEVHFQPKTKTRLQTNQHFKLVQPQSVDWSLLKSGLPNFTGVKHEISSHVQEPGKKIIPILVRKRKNRSNGKEVGVVYGKVTANRRPAKPSHRQEKNIRVNFIPEVSSSPKQFDTKGERKNEFAVSASYKVDRSSKSS